MQIIRAGDITGFDDAEILILEDEEDDGNDNDQRSIADVRNNSDNLGRI